MAQPPHPPRTWLYDIVRKMPDGAQVQAELLTGDSGRLAVSAGSSRFELACLPQEDFPQVSAGALPHKFRLDASDLMALVDKTRFAISTEETRFYLNGIYVHAAEDKDKTLRAVATDGHRLARYDLELPAGAAGMPGIIIPRKTIAELRRLLEDSEGAIEIGLSDTKIQFSFNDVELTSKLIDGSFPEYQRVIPTNNDKVLMLDAKEFSHAVDRVSTISADKTRAVKAQYRQRQRDAVGRKPRERNGDRRPRRQLQRGCNRDRLQRAVFASISQGK